MTSATKESVKEQPALGNRVKPEEKKPLMRFRLLRGGHSEQRWVPATPEEVEADLPGIVERPGGKKFRLVKRDYDANGDNEIETDRDLEKLFNSNGPMGKKFHRIDNEPSGAAGSPYPNPWDNLEDMTEDQLRSFARSQEIEIKGAKTKDEIIAALLDAVG